MAFDIILGRLILHGWFQTKQTSSLGRFRNDTIDSSFLFLLGARFFYLFTTRLVTAVCVLRLVEWGVMQCAALRWIVEEKFEFPAMDEWTMISSKRGRATS